MTGLGAMRDQTAIVGIGWTPYSRLSGVSPATLAVRAIRDALDDAGLEPDEVDGLATHHVNDSAKPHTVASSMNLKDISWFHEEFGGGSKAPAVVGLAAQACHLGDARHVVVYRALNGRSGTRMGGATASIISDPHQEFEVPFGLVVAAQHYAMAARMHMLRFGTEQEDLGAVAIQQREHARLNPRAMMQQPITMLDYMASPWIVEPFHLLDCCLETDAACAVVITTTERAQDLRQPPVLISAVTRAIGPTVLGAAYDDLTTTAAALVAPKLYTAAGVGPQDIDVAELYDAFTISVLVQLEDYGFCAKGEGGSFVTSGATALGAHLPVNTHGGHLSEGYVHGLNHICEAVTQLRGAAGRRQVEGCEVALCTAQPGYLSGLCSAMILRS